MKVAAISVVAALTVSCHSSRTATSATVVGIGDTATVSSVVETVLKSVGDLKVRAEEWYFYPDSSAHADSVKSSHVKSYCRIVIDSRQDLTACRIDSTEASKYLTVAGHAISEADTEVGTAYGSQWWVIVAVAVGALLTFIAFMIKRN